MENIWNVFLGSGYFLKLLLFLFCFMALCVLHGLLWNRVLRLRLPAFCLPALGLVGLLAAEQALCWPTVAYRLSSVLLVIGTALAALVPAVLGALSRKAFRAEEKARPRADWKQVLLACLLLAAMILPAVVQKLGNTDDAFYVGNIALFSVSDRVNPYDASFGDVTLGTVPMYDFQTWEAFCSVLCRVFGLGAPELAHTLLIAPLQLCAASAFFTLGWVLFREKNRAWLFLSVYVLYTLGARFFPYGEGVMLLQRIWMGKAVNLHVVLPLLSALALRYYAGDGEAEPEGALAVPKAPRDPSGPLGLALCVLAGVGLNPTSLYLNGFQLAALFLCLTPVYRRPRKLLALLPALVLTAFFTLMIYLRSSALPGLIENNSAVSDQFFSYWRETVFADRKAELVLAAVAAVWIAFRGDRKARVLFLAVTLSHIVFLLNPWTGPLVAEHLTKKPTYWRLFWLLPLEEAIGWTVVDFAYSRSKRQVFAAGLAGLLAISSAGVYSTKKEAYQYTLAENVEKIDPSILKIGQLLTEEGIRSPILADQTVATRLRQQYTDLWLLVSNRSYIENLYLYAGREEEANDRLTLYDFANGSLEEEQLADIPALLEKCGVEAVVVHDKAAVSLLRAEEWPVEYHKDGWWCFIRRAESKAD